MKLLIAEDEFLCRENLKSIDWASIGITVEGVAENGDEAMELVKQIKPDIIISDIEMPKMTGLELAHAVSNILPETKTIILTAYTKFEYVQESVSLGVFQYILKPFEDETLLDAAKAAADELADERRKNLKFENISRQLESCKYFLKSYFFNVAENGALQENGLFSMFGSLDPQSKYTAMVVSLEAAPSADIFSENYKIFLSIIKIISKYHTDIIPFFDISTLTFLFIHDSKISDNAANSAVLNISEAVCDYLNFTDGIKYIIGIGKCMSTLKNAPYSYNGATDALSYSFYLGFNTVICIDDVEPKQNSVDYFKFYDEGFLNHVKVGDCDSAMLSVKRLFNSFRNNQEAISTVQRICSELFVRLSMCLMQCGQNPDNLFNKTDIWLVIRKYNTIDSLEKCISNIVEVTVSHISFNRSNKNKDLIKQIQEYIQEIPSTSLSEIAEHFYHSPNYLSNIFSKETGITIKNYIIQIRIDISKKLLSETGSSIYEVANAVGYKNPQHFSMVFKKLVGVTPSAFQINARKQ